MLRRSARRINLTKKSIENLDPPESGREAWYDEQVPGLCLRISASGAKSFYSVRRVGQRMEFIRLGGWPEMTVDNARTEAQKVNGKLASGHNPANDRRAARGKETLEEAFEEFLLLPTRTKNKREKSPKTIAGYRQQYNAYLSHWGHRRLGTITQEEIGALHNRLGRENGYYVANRCLVLLRVLHNVWLDAGKAHGLRRENPADGITLFEEVDRERVLDATEWPKFWAALEAEPSQKVRDAILLLTFTGQRKSAVLSLKWVDVDLGRRLWTMPAAASKNHRRLDVPLSQPAMEVLERRFKARKGNEEYVFPAHHGGQHLQDIMRQWREILKRAGLKDLRPHDLRRSMGSWATMGGANERLVGRVLGHLDPAATAIYSRVNTDAARAVVESTGAAILAMANPPKPNPPKPRKGRQSRSKTHA